MKTFIKINKGLIIAAFFAVVCVFPTNAQNVTVTDDNSYTPDPAAMMDVKSANKGMLVPRVALVSTTSPISVTKPAGLLVWNTSTSGTYPTPGFYFWTGSNWEMISSSSSYNFSNGLTKSGSNVIFGGTLTQNSILNQGNYNLDINLNGTGDFSVQDNGTDVLFVKDDGNVGIKTNNPGHALDVNGNIRNTGSLFIGGKSNYKEYRNLASYANNPATGAFVIYTSIPDTANSMFRIKIEGYMYDGTGPIEIIVAGYSLNGGGFANYGFINTGTRKFNVRLARNGTNMVILLGDITENFTTTSLLVTEYLQSYGVNENYANGWTIGYSSSLSGYTSIVTVSDKTNASGFWSINGNDVYLTDTSDNVGIGVLNPTGKLEIKGNATAADDDPIFEVKNKYGDVVFGVYHEGVRVFFDDAGKGAKTGFAVGGFSASKAGQEYLRVTQDSVRIYIDDTPGKGAKTGFAVGGFSASKAGPEYFSISTESAAEIINPSEPRALWYPNKEAFLVGQVLIESPDSVGTNSFVTGYESRASGNYSQALGYNCVAIGDYSTAIGHSAEATGASSLALGYGSYARGDQSVAMGLAASNGVLSFAMGLLAVADGASSFAFGGFCHSTGLGSITMGGSCYAYGDYSSAIGSACIADGDNSIARGDNAEAYGSGSIAMGTNVTTTSNYNIAMGRYVSNGSHPGSMIFGDGSSSTYTSCTADNQFMVRAAGGFVFHANSSLSATNAVYINPTTGYLGVGKVPTLNLEVNGDIAIGGGSTSYSGSGEYMDFSARSDHWYAGVQNETTAAESDFYIGLYNYEYNDFLHIENDGDIGIGSNAPGNHKLYVTSAGTAVAGSTGYFVNSAATGIAMVIDNTSTTSSDNALLVTNHGTGDIASFDSYGTGGWERRFRFTYDGNGRADGSWITGGADFAEYFPKVNKELAIEPGDLLLLSDKGYMVDKIGEPASKRVIGICSDNAGFIGNSNIDGPVDGMVVVGLVGVVETKVCTENGAIEVGDFITSSSLPGVGMRATKPCMVVGRALESYNGQGTSKIKVFVNVMWSGINIE